MGDSRRSRGVALCMLGALAMSYGWGFRGNYGHEAGAMVPGALVGMALAMASGRADFQRRCAVFGMFGALGWAFGGQMSYGIVTSYTVSGSLVDATYGYACFFLIGALWAGIGSGALALVATRPHSELRRFVGPIVAVGCVWFAVAMAARFLPEHAVLLEELTTERMHDTDWLQATLALVALVPYWLVFREARRPTGLLIAMAVGWWLGYIVLVRLLGLRMTPPRSDNWAGCVGLFVAVVIHLARTRNRAGLLLTSYGTLAGGVGFAVGDLFQNLDRLKWGPFSGGNPELLGFDSWKWMEQGFGLLMGLGVALGFQRLLRGRLAVPEENEERTGLDRFAVLLMFVPVLWLNLHQNVVNWMKAGAIPKKPVLGLDAWQWLFMIGALLSVLVLFGLERNRRRSLALVPTSPLGKGQLLFLLMLWVSAVGTLVEAMPAMAGRGVFFVHVTFWLTAIWCTWLVLNLNPAPEIRVPDGGVAAHDPSWRPGWMHWLAWALAPVLILALGATTVKMGGGPDQGKLRFAPVESAGLD